MNEIQIKRKRKYPKNTHYQEDEEYRNRLRKQSRERYHKDIEYKNTTLERTKKRYYEDEEYKKATIRRAKERYRKIKIRSSLVNYFLRNGYFRFPDESLREIKGDDYKKGYEVRFVARDENELQKINSLLNKAGFKIGKAFQKNNKFVQPIYGKDSVEKFKSFLSEQKRKTIKKK